MSRNVEQFEFFKGEIIEVKVKRWMRQQNLCGSLRYNETDDRKKHKHLYYWTWTFPCPVDSQTPCYIFKVNWKYNWIQWTQDEVYKLECVL